MSLAKTLIQTSTALAVAATFGVAHAQHEERTQIVQPSSTMGQINNGGTMDRRDETVRQTQQASSTGGQLTTPSIPVDRRDETVRQTQTASPGTGHNAHRSGGDQSGQSNQPMIANERGTLQPHMANRADMPMRNDGSDMRMGNERMARADRN
ncbi:hypothetical protein [Piscinibacter sakaiensis]|uniref:hypothetical protein n=1 Tax=Piscinibacter sakaiensis TaxID=1547922 RepID=UPI003AACD031